MCAVRCGSVAPKLVDRMRAERGGSGFWGHGTCCVALSSVVAQARAHVVLRCVVLWLNQARAHVVLPVCRVALYCIVAPARAHVVLC